MSLNQSADVMFVMSDFTILGQLTRDACLFSSLRPVCSLRCVRVCCQGDECLARLAWAAAFAVACMMDEGHQNSGVTRCASHNLELRAHSLSIFC